MKSHHWMAALFNLAPKGPAMLDEKKRTAIRRYAAEVLAAVEALDSMPFPPCLMVEAGQEADVVSIVTEIFGPYYRMGAGNVRAYHWHAPGNDALTLMSVQVLRSAAERVAA